MGKLMKGLKEARTEDQQWTVLMKHIHPTKTKHLTEAEMKKFRRSATIGTGWTVQQLEAWVEECIDMGWITTPMTLHRELAIAGRMTEDGPEEYQLYRASPWDAVEKEIAPVRTELADVAHPWLVALEEKWPGATVTKNAIRHVNGIRRGDWEAEAMRKSLAGDPFDTDLQVSWTNGPGLAVSRANPLREHLVMLSVLRSAVVTGNPTSRSCVLTSHCRVANAEVSKPPCTSRRSSFLIIGLACTAATSSVLASR